jgi:hypothetical protein
MDVGVQGAAAPRCMDIRMRAATLELCARYNGQQQPPQALTVPQLRGASYAQRQPANLPPPPPFPFHRSDETTCARRRLLALLLLAAARAMRKAAGGEAQADVAHWRVATLTDAAMDVCSGLLDDECDAALSAGVWGPPTTPASLRLLVQSLWAGAVRATPSQLAVPLSQAAAGTASASGLRSSAALAAAAAAVDAATAHPAAPERVEAGLTVAGIVLLASNAVQPWRGALPGGAVEWTARSERVLQWLAAARRALAKPGLSGDGVAQLLEVLRLQTGWRGCATPRRRRCGDKRRERTHLRLQPPARQRHPLRRCPCCNPSW